MSASEIIQQAASSPRVALGVPIVTAGIGLVEVQSVLTIVSMLIGIAVALVLLGNHLIKRRILIRQEQLLDQTDKPSNTVIEP